MIIDKFRKHSAIVEIVSYCSAQFSLPNNMSAQTFFNVFARKQLKKLLLDKEIPVFLKNFDQISTVFASISSNPQPHKFKSVEFFGLHKIIKTIFIKKKSVSFLTATISVLFFIDVHFLTQIWQ